MTEQGRYIAYDLETGGTNCKKNPILTGYFTVLTEDLVQVDELFLKIRPETPYTEVDQESLQITNINLEDHLKDAITRQQASELLASFIEKHTPKRTKLIRMGYNIGFDDRFITEQLITNWDDLVHYRTLDSFNIVNFLKETGWLPQELGTLSSVVNYFNIHLKTAHDAKNDVLMSISVYDKLKGMMVNSKKPSNTLSLDLLEILEN